MRLDVYMDQLTWVNPDQVDWATLDGTVNAARERHLKIVGLLGTLPSYGRPKGTPNTYGPSTTAQRTMFAEFAAKVAKRYQGRIDTWEVWNEPNLDQFWYPAPSSSDYGKLLASTYKSIKAVAPRATVLSGGTGGRDSEADIEPIRWVDRMYSSGLRNSFDGLAMHAYTAPENGNLGEFERLSTYRSVMDRHGDQHTKLWITEAGTEVGRSAEATESVAASNVLAVIERWKNVHDHGPMFFYTLSDTIQPGFGLYRTDGSARPALAALVQAAAAEA